MPRSVVFASILNLYLFHLLIYDRAIAKGKALPGIMQCTGAGCKIKAANVCLSTDATVGGRRSFVVFFAVAKFKTFSSTRSSASPAGIIIMQNCSVQR